MFHPPPPPALCLLILGIPSRSKPPTEAATFLLVFQIGPTTTSQFHRSNPSIMEAPQPITFLDTPIDPAPSSSSARPPGTRSLLCFPRPRSISSRGAGTSSLPLPWSSRPLASRRQSPLRARAPPPLLHVKADADRIVQRQVPASSALWRPPPWPRLPSTNRAARPLSRSCQVPCSASTRRPHTLPTASSSSCLHASPLTSRGRALTSPSMPSRCVNAFV